MPKQLVNIPCGFYSASKIIHWIFYPTSINIENFFKNGFITYFCLSICRYYLFLKKLKICSLHRSTSIMFLKQLRVLSRNMICCVLTMHIDCLLAAVFLNLLRTILSYLRQYARLRLCREKANRSHLRPPPHEANLNKRGLDKTCTDNGFKSVFFNLVHTHPFWIDLFITFIVVIFYRLIVDKK